MKWIGNNLSYTIYGESHSDVIGIEIKGLPEFQIDEEKLNAFMSRRKAIHSSYSTSRIETDEIIWERGVSNGLIYGTVDATILNRNVKTGDYNDLLGKPRPSHADYASYAKFGRTDFTGGREFSGRMTAPYCIFGGIAKQILQSKGIQVMAYVERIGYAMGRSYKDSHVTEDKIAEVNKYGSWALSDQRYMLEEIDEARIKRDSIGGCIECIVFGLPAGVGYTMAEGLESAISAQVFSVPGVKGLEFGAGFDLAHMRGSDANDEFYFDEEGNVKTYSNNSGGINGGISNGMPITLRAVMRPTPSIAKEQHTVDLLNLTNTTIEIKGRHDSCIVPRAVPIIESAVAIAILDNIL